MIVNKSNHPATQVIYFIRIHSNNTEQWPALVRLLER